jgi:hypothetical protein
MIENIAVTYSISGEKMAPATMTMAELKTLQEMAGRLGSSLVILKVRKVATRRAR